MIESFVLLLECFLVLLLELDVLLHVLCFESWLDTTLVLKMVIEVTKGYEREFSIDSIHLPFTHAIKDQILFDVSRLRLHHLDYFFTSKVIFTVLKVIII